MGAVVFRRNLLKAGSARRGHRAIPAEHGAISEGAAA